MARGATVRLASVSFSGGVTVVVGPNGSGKSTLSHVLMGRPGYTVTGGTATIDGVDLLPFLKGKTGAPHENLFWRSGPKHALRMGDWKLVNERTGGQVLFNLKEDPHETKDLIDNPKLEPVKKKLLATLRKKRSEFGDGLLSASGGK